MTTRRTEPTRSLLQGAVYVNAASTDLRARFKAMQEAIEAQKKQPANVSRLRKQK